MDDIKVAKNLLENKTCNRCKYGYINIYGKYCYYSEYVNVGSIKEAPEINTCIKWIEDRGY